MTPSRYDDWAIAGGCRYTGLEELTDDPEVLDTSGCWIVVQTFEGALVCARFATATPYDGGMVEPWQPVCAPWTSSLDEASYVGAVETVRERIARGDVYQVNVCRVLAAETDGLPDLYALAGALARANPAPYAATVNLPSAGVHVASASPELFLRRDGRTVVSGPIKGTAKTADGLTAKDTAENVMIVDLVRNDLGRVAVTGSVEVPDLLAVEEHPGLVHLVSRVRARLAPGAGWAELLAATAPAGSVTGAPKSSALRLIGELEPVPRGVYCGAVGWVDADNARGELAVAIRTFEWSEGRLLLGTGAGITWGSDPRREWEETELKVSRLIGAVS
ncbi:MAG: para-aminobenzoate synthetase component [Frankiaceae bacterium]|nr:para-aminobenzoate synthetase component [Frankiaceae bacterium]